MVKEFAFTVGHLLTCPSCMFLDPGTASAAGCLALMGQVGTLSGHEVPGGEIVQLFGKSVEHLFVRSPTSQRCNHELSEYVNIFL